jgi:uncharacterized membrane protein YkvA (DUF1232 family)
MNESPNLMSASRGLVALPPSTGTEALVEEGFWPKLQRLVARSASRLPFAEDLLAAYFSATDPATPRHVRATLLAALAYFVVPTDLVPDLVAVVGFTDDAAVLALALQTVSGHIRPKHRSRAKSALEDASRPNV